ncbi:MAG: Rpn family recombination-promoting nuclease/putative transposase, partial [Planctomycetes bacterium]|nr:Rpn family recombination-promoting nuclease/putative transposase [Planctomycetota bacterium]
MGELVRSHDALFRLVFGDEQQCGELLRSRLDPALAAAIDWPSLRRLDVSFTDVDLSTSRADLLFAARLGDGIVLLHVVVEHKSGDDRFTVLQLLRYRLRVWDRWRREHPA